MRKYSDGKAALLQEMRDMGFTTEEMICDCKAHLCEKINSTQPNEAVYIAYFSKNAGFLWISSINGHCICEYRHLNEERATRKELLALLSCCDEARWCLDDDDWRSDDDDEDC